MTELSKAPATTPISPLPIDSAERKQSPVWSGVMQYAPAAIAAISRTSMKGNAKHNPGEPLHHARGKSADHQDCIARHLLDYDALRTARARGESVDTSALVLELEQFGWRSVMFVQEQLEELGVAPRAPRAVLPTEVAVEVLPK